MSLSDKDIATLEATWQELVDWKEGRLVINGLPELWATNQKAWLGGFTPALLAEVKDSRRRIAELEQGNRDLERLRSEASREREEARERHQNAEHDLGWLRLRTSSLKQELAGEREHSESMYRRACAEQSRAETAERERDVARAALREIYEGAAGNSGRCMDCDSIAQVAARTLTPI